MRPRPLLGFDDVDPSYSEAFLAHHASVVPPQRLKPFLHFLLDGAAAGKPFFRVADIITSGNRSPVYKCFTGDGPAADPYLAERRAIDGAILEATYAGTRHLLIDRQLTPHWPDGETEIFRVAANLPQGLTQIAQARLPRACKDPARQHLSRLNDKVRVLQNLVWGIRMGRHRAPVLTRDQDGEFVDAMLAAMLLVTPQREWTGKVSEYQSIRAFTQLGVTQPAKADNLDVGDLLDSAVLLPDGSAFACAQGKRAVLVAYRPASGDDCYLQLSRIREGASRDDLLASVKERAAEIETMPASLDALELHRFYAVAKDVTADVEPRYAYPVSMLLLAGQYPLYVAQQKHTFAPDLPETDLEVANRDEDEQQRHRDDGKH